jgi:hypothetical protein
MFTYNDSKVADLVEAAYGRRLDADSLFWIRWNNHTPEGKQSEWNWLLNEARGAVRLRINAERRALSQLNRRFK